MLLSVAAAGIVALTTPAAAQTLQVKSWAAACANCHGTNGKAQGAAASLAGQSKNDLISKMQAFKSGQRPATLMHQIAKGYTDEQIEQIAAYLAAQK
ncbi:MAG: c-type cytochrome [Proteobacteria bacterium]|nr:c-type cytochrome [Pseudomonadota bacterium]